MLLANVWCQCGATLTAHHVRALTPHIGAEPRRIAAFNVAISGSLW